MRRALARGALLGREVGAVVEQAMLVARRLQRAPDAAAAPRPPAPDADAGAAAAPAPAAVVFVHGFLAAGPVFDPLRRAVERHLGVETVDFTYSPTAPFERVVERLARVTEDAVRRAGMARGRSAADAGGAVADGRGGGPAVDIVGHSLGGLVARWYLQEQGGAGHVGRLVTLATPHAGTRAARVAPVALARALRPESDVIRRLRESRDRARSVRHLAIVAGGDLMVTPPESAAAIEDAEIVWIEGLGHNEMLFDRRVHAHVVRALSRVRPPAPGT
jgi:triacylglycerol esterase/lipase EstA (alpha/beta hydrolase family)